jgi:hypothetical protein
VTHWKKLREPPPYLGAWSFEIPGKLGEYRRVVFVITGVTSDKVKSTEKPKGEKCLLLWFKTADGKPVPKAMVCNATNAKTLESLYGADVEGWIDKACEVYVADVRVGSDQVKGLRISSRRPQLGAEEKSFEEAPPNDETREQHDKAFGRGQDEGREPGSDDK